MSEQIEFLQHIADATSEITQSIRDLDQEYIDLIQVAQKDSTRKFVDLVISKKIPVDERLLSLVDPSGDLSLRMKETDPLGIESVTGDTRYMLLDSFVDGAGTEGIISDAAKTVTKKALRAIGVAVTIGRYKQAVSAALTSLIGIAIGTLTNVIIRDTMTETEVFGTPEQFDDTMKTIKHINDTVVAMSELTISGTPDDASISTFEKAVRDGIRKLISYGVPMSPDGGPRISAATFQNPYFKISLHESGWTDEKINSARTELEAVQKYCEPGLRKPTSDLLDLYEGHTTLKAADKMRGRAIGRAVHYELMLIHKTNKLVRSLQFITKK